MTSTRSLRCKGSLTHPLRFLALTFLLAILQVPAGADKPALVQDQGYVALQQELQRLRTTARLMHTTAHPDDEDGGMLTLQSRGNGTTALLCSLTRGQGGQNKSGDAFSDELGVLRTLELLAADEYYGVEQRFTRVADFGFSKTPEETFEKWGGHEVAVGDLVHIIRTFRPDVLVARFSGTSRDGHAHHQASPIVTREPFRAAGDPNRFPEQLKEGLLPWQPKKLYIGNFQQEEPKLAFDIGTYSPLLGVSYTQFAVQGLAHQTSQGTGGFRLPPGHRFTYYKRVDAVLPQASLKDNESDFFDGIDTSLPGLASRIGADESKAPFLRSGLQQLAKLVENAAQNAQPRDPSAAGSPLIAGLKLTRDLIKQVQQSQLALPQKLELLINLRTKESQFERAANLAVGVLLEVSVDPPDTAQAGFFRLEQTFQTAVPGQTFTLTARFYDRGTENVEPEEIALDMPEGFKSEVVKRDLKPLHSGDMASVQFRVTVPDDAQYTKPYWGRKSAYKESVDSIGNLSYATLDLPPWPFRTHAIYSAAAGKGTVHAIAMAKYIDPVSGQGQHELALAPPFSIEFPDAIRVLRKDSKEPFDLTVRVRSQLNKPADAEVRFPSQMLSPGAFVSVTIDPAQKPGHLDNEGDGAEVHFKVTHRDHPLLSFAYLKRPKPLPASEIKRVCGGLAFLAKLPNASPPADQLTASCPEAEFQQVPREYTEPINAAVHYEGRDFSQGFHVISRADLDPFYYYHPAELTLATVDVKIPPKLKVGYIMGAGDEIPSILSQLGISVEMISPTDLQHSDLSRFNTVVLGIRAYDVRTDVRTYNSRLLDFVSRGGTLLVQYNQSVGAFNTGHYTPYPSTEANARVTIEEAPVEMLDPQNPIFNSPNLILSEDFEGWVQERGLYFMSDWDSHFHPLLESHDPGEQPLKGGLLVAQYGKGTYIYSGYAFFRQLPAGVPGAIRLFVNLLSAGSVGR